MTQEVLDLLETEPSAPAFPLRGRCPSAYTGADEVEGAIPDGSTREQNAGDTSSVIRLAGDAGCHLPLKGKACVAPPVLLSEGRSDEVSLRASEHTGAAIRSPSGQEEKETDRHTSAAALVRDDSHPNIDLRSHYASLCAQAEALRREQPDFDLDAALRDPAFLRLTAPALGVGVREAWYALHREELEARAAARSRELLARAVSSGRSRPREGGGLESAALTRSDYRSLSREARERLKQDILEASARGEKLYP